MTTRSITVRMAAAAIFCAAVGAAPAPGVAAAPTCQGRDATHVGSPGSNVAGTGGDDVVVTNGASYAGTGDGNDVVCVTGNAPGEKRVQVWTGAGADTVEVTGQDQSFVVLGVGADKFLGGPLVDRVSTGQLEELSQQGDTDTDDIATGAGDDVVLSGQDRSPDPNRDVVNLGEGDDFVSMAGGSGTAEGGPGENALAIRTGDDDGPGTWVLDNRDGTAARDGIVLWTWHDFTRFDLKHVGYSQELHVLGTDQDEAFLANGRGGGAGDVRVAAGGGADLIAVSSSQRGNFDGQAGRDLLEVFADPVCGPRRCGSVLVDLASGVARTSGGGRDGKFRLRRFEAASVVDYGTAVLRGSGKANRLSAESTCHVRMLGRGGADKLSIREAPILCDQSGGTPASAVLAGGAGADVLRGDRFGDILLGGAGRDTANGKRGRDRCVAEIRVRCELT